MSKDYKIKFFLSYIIGAAFGSIIIALFTKEGFTSLIHSFLAFTLGGIFGLAIMYFLSKDRRFM